MKVSSTYLSNRVGFSDLDANPISSKYSMHILAIAGDNGEPIAKPLFCRYMSDPTRKFIFCVQKASISIMISIGILLRSPREKIVVSLSLTTESAFFIP